ncbi:GIY-YIG nuclease family protein [Caballeronia sp. J97]|uniref:GIY-YIG nuclease family protein n=1 Tax=Caballeronia sp. J97 TaxID=2805429 RepID=UPI002AB05D33|nr:GIY-YIG nuclease family protein [Caballeronia sp. J97]
MGNKRQAVTEGWVYVLSSASYPELVKVGCTQTVPAIRARELSSTGVPTRFTMKYCALVAHHFDVEKKAHIMLAPYHEAKEFFRCGVSTARDAIRAAAMKYSELHYERIAPGIAIGESFEESSRLKHSAIPADEFAQWVRSIASPGATFIQTTALFDAWMRVRSTDAIEPSTTKALVDLLRRMGFVRTRQGGTGLRGFKGLRLPFHSK